LGHITPDEIKEDKRPGIPDMNIIVDCRAAAVKQDLVPFQGLKNLFFPGQGIIQSDLLHGTSRSQVDITVSGEGCQREGVFRGRKRDGR
jgi:hypothetical protein